MKVGIYCRISQLKEVGKDKSIEDQSLLGIAFCNSNNYNYELFIDAGISGIIEERPEFQRLLMNVIEGNINLIWVYDDSRIQRNPEVRYLLNNTLRKYKIKYFTHVSGEIDLYNPESELLGGVVAEFNKYFVTLTKLKVKSVLNRRAMSGRGWGKPPYGYSYDENGYYVLNKDESKIVERIFALSLSGVGIDSIAKILNSENIRTRYNDYDGNIKLNRSKGENQVKLLDKKQVKWAGATIHHIISNSMFYGKKKIKENIFDVPALFDIEYWENVNYNLRHNNKNTKISGGKLKYEYLLNGLIKCGKCGANYNGKTRENKKDHFYYCMNKRLSIEKCSNRSINIDKIESAVVSFLFKDARLYQKILDDIYSTVQSDKLKEMLSDAIEKYDKLKNGRSRILDLVKDDLMSIDEVKEKLIELRSEINETEIKINAIRLKISELKNVDIDEFMIGYQYFLKLDFNGMKSFLQKYIIQITVFWVEENQIKYFILKIEYIAGIVEFYSNGYSLNLDYWFKIKYDKKTESNYYYDFFPLTDKTFDLYGNAMDSDGEKDFEELTTLVPIGYIEHWDEIDLILHYGKEKYYRYKNEFLHKLKYPIHKL